jgi:hypothetical protein
MRKIPRRYSGLLLGALMAIIMGLVMSFIVTFINLGMVVGFFGRWMVAFAGALPVQFPVAVVVTPLVKAFVDRISD